MKRFFVLFFVTAAAHAACDYSVPANITGAERNRQLCEINFKCAEKAIRDVTSDPSELETLGDYGRAHNCHNELRIAALFDSLENELFDPSVEEPAVNNSDRGNSKTELPVIQDAPSDATRTSRQ
jgi:hypothetical protein